MDMFCVLSFRALTADCATNKSSIKTLKESGGCQSGGGLAGHGRLFILRTHWHRSCGSHGEVSCPHLSIFIGCYSVPTPGRSKPTVFVLLSDRE